MALFRSERGIGRGEIAESRIEAPFFAAFMLMCAVALLMLHIYVGNDAITLAVAISMILFGITIVRVEIGVAILVIAMLLSPEIDAGDVGTGSRSLNLRYDDVLIIVVFMGVMTKQAFEGERLLWRPCPVNAGIVAYYLVCLAATARALYLSVPAWDRRTALFVLLKMAEFYMLFVLVGNAVRTREDLKKLLRVFMFVGVVVSVYCIAQVGGDDRLSAPFERGGTEPNTLGGYLVLLMCVAGGLALYSPTFKLRLLFFFIVLTSFWPFLNTLSRASYTAFLVAMLVMGLKARKYVLVGVVILIVLLYEALMPQEVLERVNYTFQEGSGERVTMFGRDTGLQVDKSTYERIYVWQKVAYNLKVWPWLGGGVSWNRVLDSQYARVIIETGLLGMGAFLFLQFRILKTVNQAFRWTRDWLGRGLAAGMFVATIALIVHSFGTITFLIVRIMEPYWFLISLVVVVRDLAIIDHAHRQRQTQPDVGAKPARAPAPTPFPAPSPAPAPGRAVTH